MSTESNVLRDQWERYRYARDNGHLDYVKEAEMCENFYVGKQWDSATKRRLERLKRPAFTLNKILPNMAAVFGEQLQNRADVAFRASASGDPEVAAALDKLHLYFANDNSLDFKESYIFEDGVIGGRGFFDIRMNFDKNIRGEIQINLDNPFNVMLDPDAEEYDPASWKELWTTKWFSLEDIKRIWGEDKYKALRGKTKSDSAFGYDFLDLRPDTFGGPWREDTEGDSQAEHRRRLRVIERQYKKLRRAEHFVDTTSGDVRPIPTNWDHNRISYLLSSMPGVSVITRNAEEIWWTTTVDDVVLHNKKSIYRSFTKVPYFPFFRRGKTFGLVVNQIEPQEYYNKTMSQFAHVVASSANGGWKVKKGGLYNMTTEELQERGAEIGLVMELDDMGSADKIQPNQVPTGLDRLSYLVAEDMKDVSMVSDSQRGFDRADVAAKAIQQKKASSSVNFGKPLENLQFTRHLVARKELELVQDFFTEERTYRITGGGVAPQNQEVAINVMTPEGVILNDVTVGEYSAVVQAVPARNDYEQTQFQEAVQLRELGVAVPDHVLIEHSHLNRKTELAEEIKQKTGYGEPSEVEQQMSQLEAQIKQLEAAKMQAENQRIESETALNIVRAEVASYEPGQEGGDQQVELQKLELERQKMFLQAELEREKAAEELQIKREEMIAKLEFEKQKLELQRQQQYQKAAMEQQRQDENIAMQRQTAEAERKAAEQKAAAAQKPQSPTKESK